MKQSLLMLLIKSTKQPNNFGGALVLLDGRIFAERRIFFSVSLHRDIKPHQPCLGNIQSHCQDR